MRTKLKIFRVSHKLTQQQMAEKLGYKRAYYGHVENGFADGSEHFWKQLKSTFGLPDVIIEGLKELD